MKIAPQGWVILKCKKAGDFGVQNDNAENYMRLIIGNLIFSARFVGALLDSIFFMLFGAYMVFLWPRQILRKIQSGRLSEELGRKTLKNFHPAWGYIMIVFGVGHLIYALIHFLQ